MFEPFGSQLFFTNNNIYFSVMFIFSQGIGKHLYFQTVAFLKANHFLAFMKQKTLMLFSTMYDQYCN